MPNSRTVKSPAGQEVLVFSDGDWAELLGMEFPSAGFSQAMQSTDSRIAVLAALWVNGSARDRSGGATALLWEWAEDLARGPICPPSGLLQSSTFRACVEREIRGKRTFSTTLVAIPERWLGEVHRVAGRARPAVPLPTQTAEAEVPGAGLALPVPTSASAPSPEPDILDQLRARASQKAQEARPAVEAPVVAVDQPRALESPGEPSPLDLAPGVAGEVATALLAQVVEVLQKGPSAMDRGVRADLEDVQRRLGHQMTYVDKLRRQNREAADQLVALRRERDALRHRLRTAEANLAVAISTDTQRVIDAEVRRQLDRMMRQAPTRQSSIDADLDQLAATVAR